MLSLSRQSDKWLPDLATLPFCHDLEDFSLFFAVFAIEKREKNKEQEPENIRFCYHYGKGTSKIHWCGNKKTTSIFIILRTEHLRNEAEETRPPGLEYLLPWAVT